jgi:hypothetical protein
VSGGADWLPWRRDWSQHPNVWKVYVAYTALFVATAAVYLADGRLFGLFWVGLALVMLVVTRYVYLRSRPGRLGTHDDQPDRPSCCTRRAGQPFGCDRHRWRRESVCPVKRGLRPRRGWGAAVLASLRSSPGPARDVAAAGVRAPAAGRLMWAVNRSSGRGRPSPGTATADRNPSGRHRTLAVRKVR